MMNFRDAVGKEHRQINGEARIISLVPSITELLFALDLGDALVGRTGFCIHPAPQVKAVEKMGGTKDIKLERIRALQPTHVIVNIDENLREDAQALAEFTDVIVTHPNAPEDNLALYQLIGGVFDRGEEAQALCEDLKAALQALGNPADYPARKVLYLIWREPWMCIGRETYISKMLAKINCSTLPASAEPRYPELEPGASWLPEVQAVLASSEPYPFREQHLKEIDASLCPNAAPSLLVDGEMLSWYGSRAIPGLYYLKELAQQLDGQ